MDGFTILLVFLSIIAFLTPPSSGVRCYVCSWSPNDANNRTDVCTDEKFEPNVAYIANCDYGCETYVQWDVNDALEQWRRNCRSGPDDEPKPGRCVEDETRARIYRHCTCDFDLCNSAISWSKSTLFIPCIIMSFLLLGRKAV